MVINLSTYSFLSPFENFLFSGYQNFLHLRRYFSTLYALFPVVVLKDSFYSYYEFTVGFFDIDANFGCMNSENTLKMASKWENRQKNETGFVDEPNRKFRTHASRKKKCILWTLLGCGILNYDIILWGIKMLIGVGTNIIFIHGVDTGTSAICGPAWEILRNYVLIYLPFFFYYFILCYSLNLFQLRTFEMPLYFLEIYVPPQWMSLL